MRDFTGFRFGNIHSEDLHLVVVSSSDRYEKNLLPENKDYSIEVPGGNGSYYFGSTFGNREFKVEVAFDNVDEKTWRRISNLFATDKLQDLVFDELPYKTYRAKLKSKPEFKCLCFTDRDTKERVYKGEGTLNFICYQPFAYGFNKYVIRAADEYQLQVPTLPNYDDRFENPYEKQEQKIYNTDTKDHYNVNKNMGIPWKGGYPTIEQVRAGELYFNSPDGKKIIDVRDYFRNVPEWAPDSKLLVTPTLDYDQDLIFLPQYSKTDYINMDIGMNKENFLVGSRLLVYNPGDLPIDFELKFNNKERNFWTSRGNRFQVRRLNVQRLPIPMAVDWTGLKTQNINDENNYKYGNKYFKTKSSITTALNEIEINEPQYNELGDKHPKHAFIVEPIPREKLGDYIRMFYWQSSLLKDTDSNEPILDFEDGIRLADRYEELYDLCIDDYEKYELYWKTLKEAILYTYKDSNVFEDENGNFNEQLFDDFIYNYIHTPPEFIRKDSELSYDQFNFNKTIMPQWFSNDYFEIKTDGIEDSTLFLDTEKRMLYNINNPEYNKNNQITYKNFYNYKPIKKIYNENIEKGHWFKLPPGWSLIEITCVADEDVWGGKRWTDSRPFDWGYGGNEQQQEKSIQTLFNKIYDITIKKYLINCGKINDDSDISEIDNASNFRLWYLNDIENAKDNFSKEYYLNKQINAEYGFLKMLHLYWQQQKGKILEDGTEIKGTIDEWWWYACNYIWANFPPLYWGYADILNNIEIKYTPLFY